MGTRSGDQGTARAESADVQVRRWRKRERPQPSAVWQTVGIAFATCALGVAGVALTLSERAPVRASELWVVVGGMLLAAALCLLAHRDVNRGRRTEEFEVEELSP